MHFHSKMVMFLFFLWCIVTLRINFKFHDYTMLTRSRHLQSLNILSTTHFTNRTSYKLNLIRKARSLPRLLVTRSPRVNLELFWPSKNYYHDDRIVNQLKFKPDGRNATERLKADLTLKKIFSDFNFVDKRLSPGRNVFLEDKCFVNTCEIIRDPKLHSLTDAVVFHKTPKRTITRSSPHQIWIAYILESPYHSWGFGALGSQANWTATYRHDSDIVTPYEKFVLYNETVTTLPQNKSYAAGKTKKVAWFVTNCGAKNNRREYATELSKYIEVDIYGACGHLRCRRGDKGCFELLRTDYKFYLAFENSNCRDYITEKFFFNGLQHDVIPIVMGAAPEDYARAAPPQSYIHVDDFQTPEQLSEYLHKLDQNDDLYNEYFRWKGTGSFINTYFWCRICAMLHETSRESHAYRDLENWWRGDGVCIGEDNWRQRKRTSQFIVEDHLL